MRHDSKNNAFQSLFRKLFDILNNRFVYNLTYIYICKYECSCFPTKSRAKYSKKVRELLLHRRCVTAPWRAGLETSQFSTLAGIAMQSPEMTISTIVGTTARRHSGVAHETHSKIQTSHSTGDSPKSSHSHLARCSGETFSSENISSE